jgi:hypothetical protein
LVLVDENFIWRFCLLDGPASGIVPFATFEIGKRHDEDTGPVNPF